MESGVRVVPADQAKVRFLDVEPSVDVSYETTKDGKILVDPTSPAFVVWVLGKDYVPKIVGIVFHESEASGMVSALKNKLLPERMQELAIGADRRAVADYTKTVFQLPPEKMAELVDLQATASVKKGSKK